MNETKPAMNSFAQGSDTAHIRQSKSAPSQAPVETAASIATDDCGCGGNGGAATVRLPIPTSISTDEFVPSLNLAQSGAIAISAWLNTKYVTGLWSINQDRNTWPHIDGIGWKKLANNSSSASTALTMLVSHAFDRRRPINYREESDGMIREIYVF